MILYTLTSVHRAGVMGYSMGAMFILFPNKIIADVIMMFVMIESRTNFIPLVDFVRDKKRDSNSIYKYWIHLVTNQRRRAWNFTAFPPNFLQT